jgi:hypothetical protein
MRGILPYILLFLGSLLAVGIIMGALLVFQPGLLGLAPAVTPVAADTTHAAQVPLKPYGPTLAELKGIDSLALQRAAVAMLRDSVNLLVRELAVVRRENDSLQSPTGAPMQPAPVAAGADSAVATEHRRASERKAMVKMLETMQADTIVRLLGEMSDGEVKELLLTLKTKQAAKILAALDPDRAAKLIR